MNADLAVKLHVDRHVFIGSGITLTIEATDGIGAEAVIPSGQDTVAAAFDSIMMALLPGDSLPKDMPLETKAGNEPAPKQSEKPQRIDQDTPLFRCVVPFPVAPSVIEEPKQPEAAKPDIPAAPLLFTPEMAIPPQPVTAERREDQPPPEPRSAPAVIPVAAAAPAPVPAATPAPAVTAPPVATFTASAPLPVTHEETKQEAAPPPVSAQKPPADPKPGAVIPPEADSPRSELAFAARLSEAAAPPKAEIAQAPRPIESRPAPKVQPHDEAAPQLPAPKPQAAASEPNAGVPQQNVIEPFHAAPPAKPDAPQPLAVPDHVADMQTESPKAPVREFTVRITDPQARAADVRVVDRGGELHVAVRSGDPGLADSLRSDLSNLVSRLDRNAVHAEIWRPDVRPSSNGSAADSRGESESGSGFFQGGGQDSGQGRGNNDGRGHPRAPQWLDEFEDMPGRRQSRRETR
jgi:uncharacterized membrane protein YgcG